jgi:ribosomal protein S18 acetylase RimI-like enzyme
MNDVKIEPMKLLHLPQIIEIERTVFSTPWPRMMFEVEIGQGRVGQGLRSFSIVALRDVEVIGYAIGWFLDQDVHLVNIAVKKVHQERGVGSLLLGSVIEEACVAGKLMITLEVRASNEGAQEF